MNSYNFSAGPAMLPVEVVARIREDLPEYRDCGASILEISHRSSVFDEVADRAEQTLRRLLDLPEDFVVLFLSGGATLQFAQIPMNLAARDRPGGYLVHGHWGLKAANEAAAMGLGEILASSEASGFDGIPALDPQPLAEKVAYLHIVSNETILGTQFRHWPVSDVPLAADMTSDVLSRPLDLSRFGVIYAGAQKNLGVAGLCLLLVREELIRQDTVGLPGIFSWHVQHQHGSRYNTPPTFAWYVAGLVLEWMEEQGGMAEMERRSIRRSQRLYDYIDSSGFYHNAVPGPLRSRMNVPFTLERAALDADFLSGAEQRGLIGLKGHKAVGGMRASLYNAMPEEGVAALIAYMRDFAEKHG